MQQVWIIAPQCINSTLVEVDETDEGEFDDIKENAKLKRSSGQVVKKATKSEKRERAMHHLFARNATEWLTVREFDDTKSCIDALKEENREIWVTDLSQVATCLTEEGIRTHLKARGIRSYEGKLIPQKVAIVFGTEAVGCTAEMLNAADLRVYLPLRGFADSLNLSVATALVVHQMFILDATLVGAMTEEERKDLRRVWYPKLASQRLLSSRQKKDLAKLKSFLKACEGVDRKVSAGKVIDDFEAEKWNKMKAKKAELDVIENMIAEKSRRAVEDLVENPPLPITDMRRADQHRICYVGSKPKKCMVKCGLECQPLQIFL